MYANLYVCIYIQVSILLCFCWLGVVLGVVAGIYLAHNTVAFDNEEYFREKMSSMKDAKLPWREWFPAKMLSIGKYSCIIIPHVCIIVGTNVLYVYLKSIVDSTVVFFFVELFMVGFELIWLNVVVSRSVCHANSLLKMNMQQHNMIALQAYLSITTTIIGPMIASATTDSNCFLDAFRTIPSVTSQYPFVFCGKFDEVFQFLQHTMILFSDLYSLITY